MVGMVLGCSGNLQTSEMKEKGMSAAGKIEKKLTRQRDIMLATAHVSPANHLLKNNKTLLELGVNFVSIMPKFISLLPVLTKTFGLKFTHRCL